MEIRREPAATDSRKHLPDEQEEESMAGKKTVTSQVTKEMASIGAGVAKGMVSIGTGVIAGLLKIAIPATSSKKK